MIVSRSLFLTMIAYFLIVVFFAPSSLSIPSSAVTVAFVMSAFFLEGKHFRIPLKRALLVIICMCYFLFSYFYTLSPNYGMMKLTLLLINIACAFLISGFTIQHNSKMFFLIFASFWILIVLFALDNFETVLDTSRFERFGASSYNPIFLATYSGFVVLITFGFLLASKNKFHIDTFFPMIAPIIVILLASMVAISTGSKGPILALLCSMIYLTFSRKNLVNMFAIGVLVFFAAKSLVLVFDANFINQRFLNVESVLSRIYLVNAVDYLRSGVSLVFGCGAGCYSYLLAGMDYRMYPHFYPAELFLEFGILGVMIFMFWAIGLWKDLIDSKMFRSYVLFFLISALFTGDILAHSYLIVLFEIFRVLSRRTV